MDLDLERCAVTPSVGRRSVLRAALSVAVGFGSLARVAAQGAEDPRSVRPRSGDHLVYADGDRQGGLIGPADLSLGGPRVMAYPSDPATGIVKDGSRLNKLLVIRLDAERLSDETRRRAADGIVGYSAICTHQACDVAAWDAETETFWCPCHDSRFDPRDTGKVVFGPAPKRLAALPLTLVDGVLTAAGGLTGPVGAQTR